MHTQEHDNQRIDCNIIFTSNTEQLMMWRCVADLAQRCIHDQIIVTKLHPIRSGAVKRWELRNSLELGLAQLVKKTDR